MKCNATSPIGLDRRPFEPKYSPFWKASIAIAIEDSYGKAVGTVPAAVGQLSGNADWTFFKNSYVIPEGGKQVRFCAFLSNCVVDLY